MFKKSSEIKPVNMMEGVERKTLTRGKRMLLVEFSFRAGATVPEHKHLHEQTGYLCRGSGKLWIGDDAFELLPGSSWSIPPDAPHKAEFFEDSVAIDIFSPVREDYLDE